MDLVLDVELLVHLNGPVRLERHVLAREASPHLHEQLLQLLKTCCGFTNGPVAWYPHLERRLEEMGYSQAPVFSSCTAHPRTGRSWKAPSEWRPMICSMKKAKDTGPTSSRSLSSTSS